MQEALAFVSVMMSLLVAVFEIGAVCIEIEIFMCLLCNHVFTSTIPTITAATAATDVKSSLISATPDVGIRFIYI